MIDVIKADYKFTDYSLKYVTNYFFKDNKDFIKDDLSKQDMFAMYKNGKSEDIARIGFYCIQDSYSTYMLFKKLCSFYSLMEYANSAVIPTSYIYTRGQQIRIVSRIYGWCYDNKYIINNTNYMLKRDQQYSGAIVISPKKGYWEDVISFDFCLTGDTLVSLTNGCSKRIDQMVRFNFVLGKNNNGLSNYKNINGLQIKGKRKTVKVWLEDGTTGCCTPEHKFMLDNGEWCKAEDLKDKYVSCGLEYPEDKVCSLEEKWTLNLDGCLLHMWDYKNRERSLALARMLGFILTDGSIYISNEHNKKRKCVEVCFGTLIDAKNFERDMMLFNDNQYEYGKDNEPCGGLFWHNQRYVFKYETCINKSEYIKWFIGKLNGKIPKFIRLAHKDNITYVMVDFGYNFSRKPETLFDYNGVHCYVKVIFSKGMHKKDFDKCIQHFLVPDPENSDLCDDSIDSGISIRKKGEGKMKGITCPQKFANMIHSIPNIVVGKRATQSMKLPDFILDPNCPLSIIREFLGGLFGGDGTTTTYYCSNNTLGYISFKWTTVEKYNDSISNVFDSFVSLLGKLNVNSVIRESILVKYGKNSSIKPKDLNENPRWDYCLGLCKGDIVSFGENVGFRYCVNKSCRLTNGNVVFENGK